MATRKDEGYLMDTYGNRVKSGSGEYVRTGSYDDDIVTQNRTKAAEDKLAEDVQKKLKDDADFAAEEARDKTARAQAGKVSNGGMEAAASAPKRMLTRPGQDTSGRKQPTRPGQGAAKSEAPIVTKEQLAKSGFTNLRDFLNDQKKLKRRDGKAPDAAKPATTTSKPAGASDFLDPQQKAAGASRRAKAESEAKAAEERKNYVPRATPGARKPQQTTGKVKPYMPEQPDMSFRKGGFVSSASKRADGIAQRGKTRGRMY